MAALEFFDGVNWVVVGGNNTGEINLAGDVIGNGFTNQVTQTTFNVTRDFDVSNHKIINLKAPESANDVVNYKFMFDLLQDEIPTADLLIVRDVIGHYPLKEGEIIFDNILKSNCKYLLSTTTLNIYTENNLSELIFIPSSFIPWRGDELISWFIIWTIRNSHSKYI